MNEWVNELMNELMINQSMKKHKNDFKFKQDQIK